MITKFAPYYVVIHSDKNGFGYRMLVGMGWSEGKGLGLNESGRSEHLIISRRQDSRGIGYNDVEGSDQTRGIDLNSLLKSISARIENSCGAKGKVSTGKSKKKINPNKDKHSAKPKTPYIAIHEKEFIHSKRLTLKKK